MVHLLVFPLSVSWGPSPSAYTGTTVTVYMVFGVRFLNTNVVVLSDTCSCKHTFTFNDFHF